MSGQIVQDAPATWMRGVSWLRPTPVKERSDVIACIDCGTETKVTGDRFLRSLREQGWRMRSTGDGLDWEAHNVCPECAQEEDW